MAMTDPVGDLLTRIRNGQSARLESVTVPASRMRSNVLDVLQREGYIRGWFKEELRKGVKELRVELKYDNGKPVITRAKTSIATFKLRENLPIGCKVTLRRQRMYEFLDRLIHIALPRVRDFRGLNGKSFDGRGNFAMGLKEQIVFPEIEYDKVDMVRGMDIIICTTAKTDAEAKALLRGFDFPFVN